MKWLLFVSLLLLVGACSPRGEHSGSDGQLDTLLFEIVGFKIDEISKEIINGSGGFTYNGSATIVSRSPNPGAVNGLLCLHVHQVDPLGKPKDYEYELQIVKGIGKLTTHDSEYLTKDEVDKGEKVKYPTYRFSMVGFTAFQPVKDLSQATQ